MYCDKFNPKYINEYYKVDCINCIYFDEEINDCIEETPTEETENP